jgi:hypothetical protein
MTSSLAYSGVLYYVARSLPLYREASWRLYPMEQKKSPRGFLLLAIAERIFSY